MELIFLYLFELIQQCSSKNNFRLYCFSTKPLEMKIRSNLSVLKNFVTEIDVIQIKRKF